MSLEEELWKIFTNYALHGNPLEPTMMSVQQFIRLCRETQLVSSARDAAQAQIAVTAQLSRGATARRQGKRGSALSFTDFVEAIGRLARAVAEDDEKEIAAENALLEHVLPLAGRRQVSMIDDVMVDVADVLEDFSAGLDDIFVWYARRAMMRAPTIVSTSNKMIGYREFLELCEDFQLFQGGASKCDALLSVARIGEAYLSATRSRSVQCPGACCMSRGDFDEAIVRIALAAFDGKAHIKPSDKLRALFFYMWRAVSSPVMAKKHRHGHNKYGGPPDRDLHDIYGSALFSVTFLRTWHRDAFRDYMRPVDALPSPPSALVDVALHPPNIEVNSTTSPTRLLTCSPGLHHDSRLCSQRSGIIKASDVAKLLEVRPDIADLLHRQIQDFVWQSDEPP